MTKKLPCLLSAVLALSTPAPAPASNGITLVHPYDVFNAIQAGTTITLAAYSLAANETIVHELERASDRGANVTVYLERLPIGADARRDNAELATELPAHHVNVEFPKAPSHIKAAIIDSMLYLSDRNWSAQGGREIIVADTITSDMQLVQAALAGHTGGNSHFWTRKHDVLAAEGRLIAARASTELDVESESFSAGTPVFDGMLRRARQHDHVRLIVAAREYDSSLPEQHAVSDLRSRGVDVRLGDANEKMALDGDDVYLGSANATRGYRQQIEFGIAFRDAAIANQLRLQFEDEWEAARPL